LTQRQSVTTVQGHEWLGNFAARVRRYDAAQRCLTRGPRCVDQWARENGSSFDYVYVVTDSGNAAAIPSADFARDPRYQPVYEGAGGTLYQLLNVAR
jgi:hypothetical protein